MDWTGQKSMHFERVEVNSEPHYLPRIVDHERGQQEKRCVRRHYRVQLSNVAAMPDNSLRHTGERIRASD